MERQYNRLYKSFYGMGAAVICFLLLLSAFRLVPVDAQTPPVTDPASERELELRIQTFFRTLTRGNAPALDELLRRSVFSSPGMDFPSVEQLRGNIDKAKTDFGDIIDFERIETRRVGEDIFVFRYILKYEKHPVMWTFTFYRKPSGTSTTPSPSPALTTPNPWLLIKLGFTPNVDLLEIQRSGEK